MSTFKSLFAAVATATLMAPAFSATVTCPGSLGVPVPGGNPATRQIQVTGALAGGECYFRQGNFQGDDVSEFLGLSYTLIEKDTTSTANSGTQGILRYTGSTSGTWEMTPSQWSNYDEIFIAFHFGNGGGDPDSFIVELEPQAVNGTWTWVPNTIDQGLSNIYLFGRGDGGGGGGGGGGVPEPATLALVGLALLGAGAARRRSKKA